MECTGRRHPRSGPEKRSQYDQPGRGSFNNISLSQLETYAYNDNSINGDNNATCLLVTNDMFAVRTDFGNYVKVLVVAYGSNLEIRWVTYAH